MKEIISLSTAILMAVFFSVIFFGFGIMIGYQVAVANYEPKLEDKKIEMLKISMDLQAERDARLEAGVLEPIAEGVASWYGDWHHGKLMSNREPFDMNDITVASRSIKNGTIIFIKNLENGRMIPALVTDWGPKIRGRIIDVSKLIAKRLGFLEDGKTDVRIYRLMHEIKNESDT